MSKLLSSKKEGEFVINLANNLIKELKLFCFRIKIVGSIRRKEKNPKNIDIVIIPKNKKRFLNYYLRKVSF